MTIKEGMIYGKWLKFKSIEIEKINKVVVYSKA